MFEIWYTQLTKVMGNENCAHQIVTRPYSPDSFLDGKKTIEICLRRVISTNEFCDLSFLNDKKLTPNGLTDYLYDIYEKDFVGEEKKPDIFFYLKQQKSIEPLAPRVQIYASDIVLGNLNSVGFYRTVIDGQHLSRSNSKKYVSEILRLYDKEVIDIMGVYSGYAVDVNKEGNL